MATNLSPEATRDIGALIERMVEARDRGDYRLIEFACEQTRLRSWRDGSL
jgi:hypothetical protein